MPSVTIPVVANPLSLPKVDLILSPTPVHRLNRLSAELGIDLWIKRDDLTGFAFGGNKGRKLEYLIGQALADGSTAVVTCGGAQSNFVRQLAAACSMFNLKFAAAVMPLPFEFEPAEGGLPATNGNVLLDEILGADLRILPNGTWEELYASASDLAEEYRQRGEKVYEIPIGGSTPQGAYAFMQAGQELMQQTDPFDMILFASSSGSTQTGLAASFNGSSTVVQGMACDPEPDMPDEFALLSAKLDDLAGTNLKMTRDDYAFNLDYVGPGYGVPSEGGMKAIQTLAQKEGIFLDPIYSAKAFHGLLDLAEKNRLPKRVCFWHTGGTPALFAI